MKSYTLSWGGYKLELGKRTCVMGIVNVTPDSFSDGGKFHDTDRAISHGLQLAEAGADILDIGGESTRPFSDPVSIKEEKQRVLPVIEALAAKVSIPISIDTTKSEIAESAISSGASIINDISALRSDSHIADIAARHDVPLILMHMKGVPKTMQVDPHYDDLFGEITSFLNNAVQLAITKGVDRSKIIIDPGIGFGKTFRHNLLIIQKLDQLGSLDHPILIGPSRKAFIRHILKPETDKDIRPDLPVVETGTQAAVAASVLNGAHIVRVHNVKNTRSTAAIIDAIRMAQSEDGQN